MNLRQPLSDQEIEELDLILMNQPDDIDSMSVSMLDGFLTAVVSGPNTILPSLWMPWVWDVEQGKNKPSFENEHAAKRFYELVFRLMNSISADLMESPEYFEPLLLENLNGDDPVTVIDDWCMGFMKGLALDIEGWMPLTSAHTDWFTVLRLYGTEDGWDILSSQPANLDQHRDYVDRLPDDIRKIHRYWLERRTGQPASTSTFEVLSPSPHQAGEKIGRNDRCPCGSGKKFKLCHGSPGRLH